MDGYNYPRVITMKRGGAYRRCYMVQPYLDRGVRDIMRCAFMEIVA